MTLLLILGAACGIYLVMLLLRLASIALPSMIAASIGLNLYDHGWGALAAILCGLSAGFALHMLARYLLATSQCLWTRVPILALFMLPAGTAGYQAAEAIAGLIGGHNLVMEAAGIAGALLAANLAFHSVAGRSSSD